MRHRYLAVVLPLALGARAGTALAKKTNQPIYEDPYDIAAGGASLTRASKEGMIFSNPALLPEGGKFFRWLGSTTSLLANKESLDTAKELISNSQKGGSSSSSSSDQQAQTDAFVKKVFQNPVRVGEAETLSLITNNFALCAFSRLEPDISAHQFGPTGLPEVELQAESYDGVVVGTGIRTPMRWLSFGLTGKYLLASEPDLTASLTDEQKLQSFQNPQTLKSQISTNRGTGVDVGSLIFLQGQHVDLSLAGKVDDVGNTKMTGAADSPKEFKQVTSAGLGLTLHTGADALHMAVDYRDILDVYGDPMFKRVYAGTKLMFRTYVGLAAGYYNGYPSEGAEIDLIFLRLGFTSFTRELGDHVGVNPRHIYMMSLSMGI